MLSGIQLSISSVVQYVLPGENYKQPLWSSKRKKKHACKDEVCLRMTQIEVAQVAKRTRTLLENPKQAVAHMWLSPRLCRFKCNTEWLNRYLLMK